MPRQRSIHSRLFFFLITQGFFALVLVAVAFAANREPFVPSVAPPGTVGSASPSVPALQAVQDTPLGPLQATEPTTLEVAILSSPWAIVDSNKPETDGPRVLAVEAVITNTGSTTATLPFTVELNYNATGDWQLLGNENPVRKLDQELGPGETYHAYWFATYPRPKTIDVSHQYTVSALAENATLVFTSTNAFRPTGPTVETRRAIDGGTSRLLESTSDIIVGAVFTTTVEWDLGTNFQELLLSPVGNDDFLPSAYRLVAAKVTLLQNTTPLQTIYDRLYLDTLPSGTTHARGEFSFLALRALETRICPYTSPLYTNDFKYDNNYCLPGIPVTGTVTMALDKQVNATRVLQGDVLTYTIAYTNSGTKSLGNVWIWDDVDPLIGSIVSTSISPEADPSHTHDQRVAWNIDRVAPAGEPGSSGVLTFSVEVNGGGQDLPDQQPVVNDAYFGIGPGGLPANPVLTSTITSTVDAPVITVAKSDGLEKVNVGADLTYTLRITNSGHTTATGVVITDALPVGVDHPEGPVLRIELPELVPLGGYQVVDLPVAVESILPDGITLTNVMTATYLNEAGWAFDPESATDETTVQAPFWVIDKSDDPDPVVAGTVLTYTVTYYHNGVIPATGVRITDTLPQGVTFGSVVSQPPGWDPPNQEPGPSYILTWVTPSLAAGNTGSFVFTVTADSGASGLVTNEVAIGSTDPATQATTAETTTVVGRSDLAISKSDDPNPVLAGETLTYSLVVDNLIGPSDAVNVVISDTLPAGVTLMSVEPMTSSQQGSTLFWNLASLTSGDTQEITITVAVDSDTTGTLDNAARVSSATTEDPNDGNNLATTSTTVDTVADLVIAKSVNPIQVAAGSMLTYTLTYWNNGPSDAVSAYLTDTLSTKVVFDSVISAVPPLGPPSQDGQTLSWSLGTVAAGTSGTIVFAVQVKPDALQVITNGAVIESSTADPKTENNEDSADAFVGSPDRATIFGYVFEDLNGNKIWDPAELPLEGVTISLDGTDTATTDADGLYYFITDWPGVHVVVETDPAGYFSTTPNEVHVDVALGNGYQVDFGDAPDDSEFANIHGTVFKDLDGDRQYDDNEVGIPGVVITLDGTSTTTTDDYGSYSFLVDQAGVHVVVETDPAGYFSTTPNEVHVDVALGNGYQVDFGDAPDDPEFANIHGTVFKDLDGDRQYDDNEVGIPGVVITLDGTSTTTTDDYGSYSFLVDQAGVHVVVETDSAGYFSTTPNEVHVDVALGNGYQVDFGDAPDDSEFAVVYGTVFEDSDSDGTWGNQELGIEGVTVTLDGDKTATTDQYGSYSLSTPTAGSSTVVETDLPEYLSTTPNEVEVDLVLGHGYQIDFGDVLASACTCGADEFEEDDTREGARLLEINEEQDRNFCDDATDWIQFEAQAGFVYTITTWAGGPDWYWGRRADTDLALYDGDGTLLVANDDYEGTDDYSSQIVWRAPAGGGGTYYLHVTNRAGLSGCITEYEIRLEQFETYHLYMPILARNSVLATPVAANEEVEPAAKVNEAAVAPEVPESVLAPRGVISHTCPDAYEIDDTWDQATPVEAGIVQVRSFDSNPALYAADKDFLWFDAWTRRTVTVTLPTVTNTETLLELYGRDGTELLATGTDELVWTAGAPGRYYLGISPGLTPTTFGCADQVGYELLVEMSPQTLIYMPIVLRDNPTP